MKWWEWEERKGREGMDWKIWGADMRGKDPQTKYVQGLPSSLLLDATESPATSRILNNKNRGMMFHIRDAYEWNLQFWSQFHVAYVVVMSHERQSASAGDVFVVAAWQQIVSLVICLCICRRQSACVVLHNAGPEMCRPCECWVVGATCNVLLTRGFSQHADAIA